MRFQNKSRWLAGLALAALAAALYLGIRRRAAKGFADVTDRAGLGGVTNASALTVFDADKDGRPDVFVVRAGSRSADSSNLLFLNNGDGTFRDAAMRTGLGHGGSGAIAGDYDNDGNADLLVTNPEGSALYHNNADGTFSGVTAAAGLGGAGSASRALFVDADLDGSLDLLLVNPRGPRGPSGAAVRVYRNNGRGAFRPAPANFGIAGGAAPSGVFPSDFDHDRDVDLLVTDLDGPVKAYRNDRQEGFVEEAQAHGLDAVRGAAGLLVEDFNGDRRRDFLFLSSECAVNRLYLRKGYRAVEELRSSSSSFLGNGGNGVAALDFDNDGDMDLLISGACQPASVGLVLLENRGDATFQDATSLLPSSGPAERTSGAFAFGDYDDDGDSDLFVLRGGRLSLLRNDVEHSRFWIKVRLVGAAGSPRDGFGAKIEAKSGEWWVEREVHGLNGSSSQGPGAMILGLGGRGRVDLVRVTWPSSIRQKLTEPSPRGTLEVVERPCRPMGHGCAEEVIAGDHAESAPSLRR